MLLTVCRRVALTGVTAKPATIGTLRGRLLCPVAVEPPVAALRLEQLIVRPVLDHATVLEDEDPAGVADRREAVGDHDRGAAGDESPQTLLDQALGVDVHVR